MADKRSIELLDGKRLLAIFGKLIKEKREEQGLTLNRVANEGRILKWFCSIPL